MARFAVSLMFVAAAGATSSWPMVGWDAYRNYDLSSFRPGEVTREFSSYDRADGNDDGFEGTYSCLRNTTDGRCVIADAKGPGEIGTLWFTYEPDSILKAGDIKITLDGKDVLTGVIQDIVDGKKGSPFVWPFVGNTNDTMGGNVIKVPMPYSKSMLVTTSNNPHFYHLYYRTFPAGTQVTTFDPSDKASDIISAFRAFGVKDPKTVKPNSGSHVSKSASIASGQSGTVQLAQQCGTIQGLSIRIPSILATAYANDDGRAFGTGGGGSKFTMALDSNNKQCRLAKRIDATIGHQRLAVTVNGKQAGYMTSSAAVNATWQDQSLDLSPSLTNGQTSIKVATSCVSSDLDCNEFMWTLHCTSKDGTWKSPGYIPSTQMTLMDQLNVGWNNPQDEAAHGYTITKQTFQGLRDYRYSDKDHSLASLPDVSMTLNFDGTETVSKVPIGSFFGTAMTKSNVRSLMLSVDPFVANGAWTSFWPMPFTKSATLTITNGDSPIKATIDAVIAPCKGYAPVSQPWGYFRTQHNRGETVLGKLWSFLSTTGPGIAYGVTQTFRGSIVRPNNTLEFLEGDDKTWIGRTTPGSFNTSTLRGTGTEDFYESGWYWEDANAPGGPVQVPYAMPLSGLAASVYDAPGLSCVGSCLSAVREMLPESQAFPKEGISFNIEHGPVNNNVTADYETTAFYYK